MKYGYETKEIFDNGNTIALFTRAVSPVATLVVTFEAGVKARYTKDELLRHPTFGKSFLLNLGCDVLSFCRRRPLWYQDLSLCEFDNVLAGISGAYERVYLYGSSGGAYAALYFSRNNDFFPIAISPRMSIHPKFGSDIYRRRHVPYLHEQMERWSIQGKKGAVIYDPHDKFDNQYVRHIVKRAFPRLDYVKVPHSGHPSGLILARSGQLQQLVRGYISGDNPVFSGLSTEAKNTRFYVFNLAKHAVRHGRYRAALRLLVAAEKMPEMGRKANEKSIKQLRDRCVAALQHGNHLA
ncbi:hypothetical protein [Bordetella sp. 02P26C-1]|uniref:hypothetical protein n=1 Tax=Bordetella sp. 02P26C-1 TaxID=2683195 RepID=UPI0013555F46|nr:hypothetical protein [Bordetella sp. 02P26C-1]MVW80518.1 hypothetical protein [Bordetella sp. 02P26C-1]